MVVSKKKKRGSAATSYSEHDSVKKIKTSSQLSSIMDDGLDFDGFEYPRSPVSPPYESPKIHETYDYRQQTVTSAENALAHYNKEKGTIYQLVKALNSSCFSKPDGIVVHCDFEAMQTDRKGNSSTKRFFAELLVERTQDVITYCDILKGRSHGCKECGKDSVIKHPPSGFLLRSCGDVPFTIHTRRKK